MKKGRIENVVMLMCANIEVCARCYVDKCWTYLRLQTIKISRSAPVSCPWIFFLLLRDIRCAKRDICTNVESWVLLHLQNISQILVFIQAPLFPWKTMSIHCTACTFHPLVIWNCPGPIQRHPDIVLVHGLSGHIYPAADRAKGSCSKTIVHTANDIVRKPGCEQKIV